MFGINQLDDVSDEMRYILEELGERKLDLSKVREEAVKQINKEQIKREKQYNNNRNASNKYDVGDYIMY